MFEGFKAKRAQARANKAAVAETAREDSALASWQTQRDALASLVEAATAPGTVPEGLVTHRGEQCYGTLSTCSLIEERKGPGHFVAGSAGVSIPIGSLSGHPIRYRVGATRGHFVAGTPAPTAIATGTLFMTDQRLCFLSSTQTRECRFDRLVGMTRDDEQGTVTLSVSNRQHPIVLAYGPDVAGWVSFHLDLALAHWRGDVDTFVANLTEQLDDLDRARPVAPVQGAGAPSAS